MSPQLDIASVIVKLGSCLVATGTAVPPRSLSYNPAENAVLVCSDAEGGTYDLYMVPRDAARGGGEASVVRAVPDWGSRNICSAASHSWLLYNAAVPFLISCNQIESAGLLNLQLCLS